MFILSVTSITSLIMVTVLETLMEALLMNMIVMIETINFHQRYQEGRMAILKIVVLMV